MASNSCQPNRASASRPKTYRPTLEALEDRLAPATFTVLNTDNAGIGSLRQAILNANAAAGLDRIEFNIPTTDPGRNATTGAFTIRPATTLPGLSGPVVIDGYTQPGCSPNTQTVGTNAVLLIELDGSLLGRGFSSGLVLFGGGSTVRGLVVNRFISSSTNGEGGIRLQSDGNTIVGNFVGTDPTGRLALPNSSGVVVAGGQNNVIGGSAPADRNLISGNRGGDFITGGVVIAANQNIGARNSTGNRVLGNLIGTTASGIDPLGNEVGVLFTSGVHIASGNTVGGLASGEGNVIAFSSRDSYFFDRDGSGILAIGNATNNSFLGNSIFSNAGLGINLGSNTGVLPNDPNDADGGNNNGQNFPVITEVTQGASNTTVAGTLDSVANTRFRIEFFSNDAVDSSSHGEGQTFLGFIEKTTDSNGDATFSIDLPAIAPTQFVTSTATLLVGGVPLETSEFSRLISDVSVTKIDTPDPGFVGRDLTYTLTVTAAPGPFPSGPVTLVDTLPVDVDFVSATTGQGTSSQVNRTVTFNLGVIPAGTSVTATVVVRPRSEALDQTITNSATVLSPVDDPDTANNIATATTTVVEPPPTADLAVSKTAASPILIGQDVTYTVSVRNNGPDAAANAVLIDTLPTGVTFVSATDGVVPVNGVLTFNVGALANQQSAIVTIVVRADVAGQIFNTATATTDTDDPDASNNAAAVTISVTGAAARANISGTVYLDYNANGAPDPGEPGLAGRTVYLDANGNDQRDPGETTAVTDGSAQYAFASLADGTYTVRRDVVFGNVIQTGTSASGRTITLRGSDVGGVDFGEVLFSSSAPILVNRDLYGTIPNPDTDTAYIQGLYHVLLGRPGETEGVAGWLALLQVTGDRVLVAQGVVRSPEHRGLEVDYWYRTFLHREADAAGRNHWIQQMLNGADETEVVQCILLSPEYQSAHADNATFARDLYFDLLGRLGSAGELSSLESSLAGGLSRQAALDAFIRSDENRSLSVTGFYAAVLHRPVDSGSAGWEGLLRGRVPAGLVEGIILGDPVNVEFYQNGGK